MQHPRNSKKYNNLFLITLISNNTKTIILIVTKSKDLFAYSAVTTPRYARTEEYNRRVEIITLVAEPETLKVSKDTPASNLFFLFFHNT
jgi:hypothetical protein